MLGSGWIAGRRLAPALLAVVALGAAAPAAASAADRFVATTGDDSANNCLTEATPCLTIQHAVDESGNGDVINVAAGTYAESVLVGVSVEIDGPFVGTAGSDSSRGGADEARIVPDGTDPAVTVDADDVSLQGLTIGPAGGPALPGTTGVLVEDFAASTSIVDTLIENLARGIDLRGVFNPLVVFSAVHGATDAGIFVEDVGGPFITSNELSDGDGDGIRFWPGGGSGTSGVTFDDNDLHDLGGDGIAVVPGSVSETVPIHGNRIVDIGIAGLSSSVGDVDATNNWWGCNAGPLSADCTNTSGTDESEVTPWTVMTLSANPTTIVTGGDTSQITASFNTNSNGDPIGPPEQGIPDHVEVAFSTTLGTVDPSACTCGGEALVTLTSGATPGTATVTGTLDNESLTTPVQIVGPSLQINPAAGKDFGSVKVGAASSLQKFTVKNIGTDDVSISDVGVAPPDFADFELPAAYDTCTGETLTPGAFCSVKVRFRPVGTPGTRSSALVVANGPPLAAVALSGTALTNAEVTIAPAAFDFGTVALGATSPLQKLTVKNTGGVDVTLGSVALGGANPAEFSLPAGHDGCSGQTLAPGEFCAVKTRFQPTSAGPQTALLEVPSSDLPATATATLTGSASTAPAITVAPAPFSFGSIPVRSRSPTQKFTVKNTGGSDLQLGTLTVAGTDAAQFRSGSDTCSNQTLAPAAFCTIKVRFVPAGAPGARQAQLSVPSDAPGSPATVDLSGTGIAI